MIYSILIGNEMSFYLKNSEWLTDDTDVHGKKLLCKSAESVRRFKRRIELLWHKSATQQKQNRITVAGIIK